ncbi:fibronectin type III domain-containing protein [Candidatus Riflebacteria bacterium]
MKFLLACLIFLSSFFYFGCMGGGDISNQVLKGESGQLSLKVSFKHSLPHGSVKAAVDPQAFGVTTMRVTVTPVSGAPVVQSFSYAPGGSGTVDGIPVGQATVNVEALDSASRVVFTGSINVEILSGVVTEVDSLVLFEEADSTVSLAIADIQVSNILATSARIDFLTNRAASVIITYGLSSTGLTGSQNADSTPVTNHQVLLSGLLPMTQYFYKITVNDGQGGSAESSVLSFTTSQEGETSEFIAKINDGASYTNHDVVTLNLSASTAATQVKIAEGTDASAATAQAISSSISFTLSTGDGIKTVTIIFLDANGGALAELTTTITLDQTAPTLSSWDVTNVTDTNATISGVASEDVIWNFALGKTAALELYNASGTQAVTSASINNSSFGALTPNTIYYWRVTVTDLAGNSLTTPTEQFNTNPAAAATINNTYVSEFGNKLNPPYDDGTLINPKCIAIDAANVSYVVTDGNTNNFQIFGADGVFVKSFGGNLPFSGIGKSGMDVEPDGSKLVLAYDGALVAIDLANPVSSMTTGFLDPSAGLLDVKIGTNSQYIGLVERTAPGSSYHFNNFLKSNLSIVATFTLDPLVITAALQNMDFLPPAEVAWTRGTAGADPVFFWEQLSAASTATVLATMTAAVPPDPIGFFRMPLGSPQAYSVKFNNAGSKIFVSTLEEDRIQVFDPTGPFPGSFTSSFGSPGASTIPGNPLQISRPIYLDVDSSDNLHIVDYNNNRIAVANTTNGNFIREYGTASPAYHSIVIEDIEIANTDKLYAVRPSDGAGFNGLVSVYSESTGFLYHLCFDSAPTNPYRIAHVPGSTTFFILEGATPPYTLVRYSETTSSCTTTFSQSGPAMGGPTEVILDLTYVPSTNEVWITASSTNSHIHHFNAADLNDVSGTYGIGTNIGEGGPAPQPAGLFTGTYGIATDDSSLFISDYGNQRIQVWTVAGVYSKSYSTTFKPHLIVYTNSRLYVSDTDNHKIHILSSTDGTVLGSFGVNGAGASQFYLPLPIAVSPTHFWVADANSRIQKFLQ